MYNIYHYPIAGKPFKHVVLKDHFAAEKAEPQKHDERLAESYSRTRRYFMDYAFCNEFDLFVTITFDPKKYNSVSYDDVQKALSKWFNNFKSRHDKDFQYMLIPEKHKNGAWHFHGLMTAPVGICSPLKIPKKVKGRVVYVKNTPCYLSWPAFARKFGHFSAGFIRDYTKAVRYITKYISKDFIDFDMANRRILLKSKGLRKPDLVYQSFENVSIPGYSTPFCTVNWTDELEVKGKVVPYKGPVFEECEQVKEIIEYSEQLRFG